MSHQFEAVVIGAGIVGLAVARALALQGRTVLVKNKPTASPIAELNIAALIPGTYILKVILSARETAQVTFIKR